MVGVSFSGINEASHLDSLDCERGLGHDRIMKKEAAFVLLAAWLWFTGCSREDVIVLKDGRTIRTWSTTFGTNHVAPGQIIPRLDKELSPGPQGLLRFVSKNASAQLVQVSTETPSLAVWTHPISDPTNSAAIPTVQLGFPGRVDSAGMIVYFDGAWGLGRDRAPGVAILTLFPRRESVVDLEARIIEPGTRGWPSSSGTLHLRNPRPFSGPSWKPDALPIERSQNGIRATLYDLSVTNLYITNKAGTRLKLPRTWIRFEATDSSNHPLRVLGFELSDPGGNRLPIPIGKVLEKDRGHPCSEVLFDDEPAWRLRVEMELPANDPSTTVDRVEFSAITEPPDDDETGSRRPSPAPMKGCPSIQGMELSLYQFSAGTAPKVQLGVRGSPPGIRVELERVVDETGRIWNAREIESSSMGAGGSDGFHSYVMSQTSAPGAAAKSLNFLFRIHRTAIFEFHPPARFVSAEPDLR